MWTIHNREDLRHTSAAHHHLICPRQVLGVRAGLLAGQLFELALPLSGKRLLAISETDGCSVDGLSAATGCSAGRRTLRIEDYGKTAATVIDTLTERAIRVAPRDPTRQPALDYAPAARKTWEV